MAAGTWQFTESARTKMLDGTFDFDSDSFKVALFLSSSNLSPTSTSYAGLTNEHANANGYVTGGAAVTLVLSGLNTVKIDFSVDPEWTAAGGDISAHFAVLYEVSGDVVCWCYLDDTPADVTVSSGDTLRVAAHVNGVFTLS